MKFLKYLILMGLMLGAILLFNMDLAEDDPKAITIAFYNVENLFDTINDPHTDDEKFLPQSKARWNSEKYFQKVKNLSKAIDQLGDANGPEILGLSEIENATVLKDLIHSKNLRAKNYDIIQFDSKDKRGIDVALLYKKNIFSPYSQHSKRVALAEKKNYRTRDILIVSGKIKQDTIHFIINHWPSRLGGAEKSEANRVLVAKFVRTLVDSLFKISHSGKIMVMGDFNDEPSNKSISEVLKAKNKISSCNAHDFYNPFYDLMKEGVGSYKYEGQWDLLDQIILSKNLGESAKLRYKVHSADVYDPIWLYYKESTAHGPFRTFMGNKYYGGYSDHFPVYIQLEQQ